MMSDAILGFPSVHCNMKGVQFNDDYLTDLPMHWNNSQNLRKSFQYF